MGKPEVDDLIKKIAAGAGAEKEAKRYYTFEEVAGFVGKISFLLKIQEVRHALGVSGAEIYIEAGAWKVLVMRVPCLHGSFQVLGYEMPSEDEIVERLGKVEGQPEIARELASEPCSDPMAFTRIRRPGEKWGGSSVESLADLLERFRQPYIFK